VVRNLPHYIEDDDMGIPDLHLTITGGQLSDLFFNYDHPRFDKLQEGEADDDDKVWSALEGDVEEFLQTMGVDEHAIVDLVPDFIRDFLSRV
jgi:hypothetical protein